MLPAHFPPLEPVASFLALDIGNQLCVSREPALGTSHVQFPRLEQVAYFPALGTVFMLAAYLSIYNIFREGTGLQDWILEGAHFYQVTNLYTCAVFSLSMVLSMPSYV